MAEIKLLRGVTHVIIITAPSREDMNRTGIMMTANLCFGPGTKNHIGSIDYILQAKGDKTWRLPSFVHGNGKDQVSVPIFSGVIGEEIVRWATQAAERVKRECGTLKLNKMYLIPSGESTPVQDITASGEDI